MCSRSNCTVSFLNPSFVWPLEQAHVLEAVQKAADEDPVKFNAVLKQVLEPEAEEDGESVSFMGKMRGMLSRKSDTSENGATTDTGEEQPAPAPA